MFSVAVFREPQGVEKRALESVAIVSFEVFVSQGDNEKRTSQVASPLSSVG